VPDEGDASDTNATTAADGSSTLVRDTSFEAGNVVSIGSVSQHSQPLASPLPGGEQVRRLGAVQQQAFSGSACFAQQDFVTVAFTACPQHDFADVAVWQASVGQAQTGPTAHGNRVAASTSTTLKRAVRR
jgi:hypothetical protein